MWEEKLKSELALVQRRLRAEKRPHNDKTKLPKLKITPLNGTAFEVWISIRNEVFQSERKDYKPKIRVHRVQKGLGQID